MRTLWEARIGRGGSVSVEVTQRAGGVKTWMLLGMRGRVAESPGDVQIAYVAVTWQGWMKRVGYTVLVGGRFFGFDAKRLNAERWVWAE